MYVQTAQSAYKLALTLLFIVKQKLLQVCKLSCQCTSVLPVNNLHTLTRDSKSGTNWRCTLKTKVKDHVHADVSWKLLASLAASLHHKWVPAYKPQFDKHVHCIVIFAGGHVYSFSC